MNRSSLIQQVKTKKSFLCVGLDTDITKLPPHLSQNQEGILDFNQSIIHATLEHCVAYKINTAFYESLGVVGWEILEKTIQMIPDTHLVIADAKRGDIGNTSSQYAKAFFDTLKCDALTVAPYMGYDSLKPFLDYRDKFTICLGLTSNEGARDFQLTRNDGSYLYEDVIRKVSGWGTEENLMFVIGASQALELANVRKIIPNYFLLIPGVGAQGGSLKDVFRFGANENIGLLVNASRSIIYASSGMDYAEAAMEEAQNIHSQMSALMNHATVK
jgi:orotidine-5'-phosphate decarboxylase